MNQITELSPEELGPRQKIIEAATVLFANEGLHGTSTRDIAKESGMNLSLISYYFGGKESLYRTVIQEFVLHVFSKIETVVNEFEQTEVCAESIHRALDSLIETLIDMRVANPHIAKIMTREKLSGLPFSREIHETMMTTAGEKLETIIARGQQAGVVKEKINPRFFLICLVESVMGYFNMLDCNCSWNKGLYAMPEHRQEFKNQISMLYLEGILK
ncbi:TetR/AcrR family transcriptional regulator [Bdellovibrio sp. HCB-162]|uniref:TetR/AcrR family transcriptional regulator n=1 Tax=Bdellovibrio sp. HCB-162 TaxID=3394234 RepID=UPI0039BCFBFF